MEYRWNPEQMAEVFVLPAAVADRHIRLAGPTQLKVLLWLARSGRGSFDAAACSAAIGYSPADCADAVQYWLETGILMAAGEVGQTETKATLDKPKEKEKKVETTSPVKVKQPAEPTAVPPLASRPAARPAAVKPQMKEVLARQKESPDFSYLLEAASARLGKAISPGDMETLLYLFDTACLPAEVIMMVIEYAVADGKTSMRYVERVALDWADHGIDNIAAAEAHLCGQERLRQSWEQVRLLLELPQSGTATQKAMADRWIAEWRMKDDLIRLARDMCVEKIGKVHCSYIDKILEHWHLDGIDTVEKAKADSQPAAKKKPQKETSLDMDAYMEQVMSRAPVYKGNSSK